MTHLIKKTTIFSGNHIFSHYFRWKSNILHYICSGFRIIIVHTMIIGRDNERQRSISKSLSRWAKRNVDWLVTRSFLPQNWQMEEHSLRFLKNWNNVALFVIMYRCRAQNRVDYFNWLITIRFFITTASKRMHLVMTTTGCTPVSLQITTHGQALPLNVYACNMPHKSRMLWRFLAC